MTPREAVDRIRELREGNSLGGLSIKDLINEGRKYEIVDTLGIWRP